ncbi:MAG: GNAT family N-acetyltransferase, partial [Singulisphaera sp.]
MVVHGADVDDDRLPGLAIRPYPTQYVAPWTMKDGTAITIRPIRPEDEPLMVRLHEALSESSVHLRYFHAMKLSSRVAHERLTRICFIDYDREMALVADRRAPDADAGGHEILAVGRLCKRRGGEAEFALLVRDEAQGVGLGTELLRRLIAIGRDERLRRIVADILPENLNMQRIC